METRYTGDVVPAKVGTPDHWIMTGALQHFYASGAAIELTETTTTPSTTTTRVVKIYPSNTSSTVVETDDVFDGDLVDYPSKPLALPSSQSFVEPVSKWNTVPLWFLLTSTLVVAGGLTWTLYNAVVAFNTWVADNAVSILTALIGIPICFILVVLLGKGSSCPGVVMHCPGKH